MASLVPYAGAIAPRTALYGFRAASRIQRAYRAYRFASRFKRRAMPYVRYGKRRYRAVARAAKRRRFSPPNPSVGTANSKRHVIQQDSTSANIATRTLTVHDLSAIPHSANNTINERQRNMINLRGTKICMELKNNLTAPLYVNCAVIVPKLATAPVTTDFFRGSDSSRAQTFSTTTLTGLQFHCLPINADKYHILWHKRYKLVPLDNTSGAVALSGKNYMTISKYVKYKRQIRYSTTGDVTAEGGAPHFVFWSSTFDSNAGAGSQAAALTVQRRFVSYFKEPKS